MCARSVTTSGVASALLPAGTVLGPAEIGLLAGLGFTPVPVRRRPRVSVLSTGDELVEPGEPVGPGQIRDSNRFSIVTALESAGADVVWSGKGPDERDALERVMRERIAESDVVITSGGVSMGELDLIKAILGDLATVYFRRIFMKPGKPLNFATVGETLLFGLPGNPVSALVGFELFVRPALAVMAGRDPNVTPRVNVTLQQETPPTDRIEYQRAIVSVSDEGRLIARTTGGQASSRLASFLGANAFLVIPPQTRVVRGRASRSRRCFCWRRPVLRMTRNRTANVAALRRLPPLQSTHSSQDSPGRSSFRKSRSCG